MKQSSKNKQNKEELVAALMSQGLRKGYLKSDTILKQLSKYNLDEDDKEKILLNFEQAGISIISPDFDSYDAIYAGDEENLRCSNLKENLPNTYKTTETKDSVIPDPLHLYWEEISKYPTLSHKETLQLVRRIKSNNDMEAKERLIVCHLKFAAKTATRYSGTGIPILDLIQQANLGLLEAAEHYNPNRGTQFTSYAVFWIKRSIIRYIDTQIRTIKLPANIGAELTKIKKIRADFYTEHMRTPTDDEIAPAGGFSISRVKYLQTLDYTMVSADLQPTEDMEGTILDTLSDESKGEDPFIDIKNIDRNKTIYSFLEKLSEREQTVLILRFGLESTPMTLEEIGHQLNLTREGVRRIEVRAIAKLRNMPDISGLQDYL